MALEQLSNDVSKSIDILNNLKMTSDLDVKKLDDLVSAGMLYQETVHNCHANKTALSSSIVRIVEEYNQKISTLAS